MYNMKASLMYWPLQTPQCKKSRFTVKAVGLASKGSLQVCWSYIKSMFTTRSEILVQCAQFVSEKKRDY